MSEPANIEGLVGRFYGAHGNRFKIGDTVYEAVEDPDDCYRSMLDEIVVSEDQDTSGFFGTPIARVRVVAVNEGRGLGEDLRGFEVRDLDRDHVWLRMGTGNYSDWYPMFVFDYTPLKEPASVAERSFADRMRKRRGES